MSEQAQAFDTAFMPVDLLKPGIANVTDEGVTLLVQPGYCPFCRQYDDGEGPCRHKDALAEAIRQHIKTLPLPFDSESESALSPWQSALYELEEVGL